MIEVPDGFRWPGLWRPFPLPPEWLGKISSAEEELQSETCAGHVLHRVASRAVAYHAGNIKQFLFVTDDPAAPLVFVHLTFQTEIDPRFPWTVVYPGWEAFRSAWEGSRRDSPFRGSPSSSMLVALAFLIGGALLLRALTAEPNPSQVGHQKSSFLTRDLAVMWETKRLQGSRNGLSRRSSTDRAINAASRVFNTLDLAGRTRDEVIDQLGDPRTSSDSVYNFPFWPAPEGALVYRFDSGSYGWQFNVMLGADDRVREVERHWIH